MLSEPCGTVFSFELIEHKPGLSVLRINGPEVHRLFKDESGGHRVQRIPPTEKNGRVQTSTITVAILEEPTESEFRLERSAVDIHVARGSGPGGQHRNKTETAVTMVHKETGITVHCETERSQLQNIESAFAVMRARMAKLKQDEENNLVARDRRKQIGSGERGDKRRTIRYKDGIVTDHILGKKWRLSDYLQGIW